VADLGSHARHDRFAIAAAVSGGPAPPTIQSCPSCWALYADLTDLREAIRRAWTPSRVRDLRLTSADGARLRPHGLRAVLRAIGSAQDSITRPLAIGFTTIGLAGLLVTTAPALQLGSAAAGASEAGSGTVALSVPDGPMASAAASAAPAVPSTSGSPAGSPAGGPSDLSTAAQGARNVTLPDRSTGTALLSVGFLTLGVGLFGLRRSARRGGMR
jgi:hypothetical protein